MSSPDAGPRQEPLPDRVDVLVIGGAQAGLGTAYELQRTAPHLSLLILEGAPEIGHSWTQRWDSLRLFTPRHFSALPGLPFPTGEHPSPSRREMAAYLRSYARDLPVRTRTPVQRLTRTPEGFLARTPQGEVHAGQVVIATGPFHDRFVPAAAQDLDPSVHQLHSYDYDRPADLPRGHVTIVGGGNSAAQLALDLLPTHRVTLITPGEPWFVPDRVLGLSTYWPMQVFGILSADAHGPVSRYVRRRGDAIFGRQLLGPIQRGELTLLTSRVTGGRGRTLVLQDDARHEVQSVLWCTGFHAAFPWLSVAGALDDAGQPLHDRGASPVPGLHWMGLPWQSRLDSSIVHGIGPDARRTARRVAGAVPAGRLARLLGR